MRSLSTTQIRGPATAANCKSEKFTELSFVGSGVFDRDGPTWTRARQDVPGFFDLAVLWSDPWRTNPRELLAFDTTLLPLGTDLLSRVVKGDPAALAAAGRFMLYEAGNLAAAIVYLERARAAGAQDSAIDLAVAAMFEAEPTEAVRRIQLEHQHRGAQNATV